MQLMFRDMPDVLFGGLIVVMGLSWMARWRLLQLHSHADHVAQEGGLVCVYPS